MRLLQDLKNRPRERHVAVVASPCAGGRWGAGSGGGGQHSRRGLGEWVRGYLGLQCGQNVIILHRNRTRWVAGGQEGALTSYPLTHTSHSDSAISLLLQREVHKSLLNMVNSIL